LVDLVFPAVNEVLEELVGLRAAGRAVGPRSCEGTTSDGRPGDQAYTCVLTVRNLQVTSARVRCVGSCNTYHLPLFLAVDEVVIVLHTNRISVGYSPQMAV
jgi:hypothetical protein